MNGLDIDKDTFRELDDKNQHLVLYDLIKATHEQASCAPENCVGIKGLWTHVKIQWWWISIMSAGILAGAYFIIRSGIS